ncbi:MAG: hypothetical protein MUF18_15985 [Fimbriiglobus sp.]|jgi:hypothetical protein|nr:hypothetical protein [Fimbriiglobus sp.]
MRSDLFMKMTAWLLIVLGVVLSTFCLLSLNGAATSETATTPATQQIVQNGWPLGAILGPFAVIALVAGVGLLLFGGRGAIRTRNPAIRN